MSTTLEVLQIAGANRGGTEYCNQLMARGGGDIRDLVSLDINDPIPDRAMMLAKEMVDRGFAAEGREMRAKEAIAFPASVRTMAIDDVKEMNDIVTNGSKQKRLGFGILASSGFPPHIGGTVIAFGGAIAEDDKEAKQTAGEILRPIIDLTGGNRQTSRVISSRSIESIQLATSRRITHGFLADDQIGYLKGKESPSKLFIGQTLTPEPPFLYPIQLVKLDRSMSQTALRDHSFDLAKEVGNENLAVVYVRPGEPWFHADFMVKRGKWWEQATEFEIPTPDSHIRTHRLANPLPQPANENLSVTD